MPEHNTGQMGGTMRLGKRKTLFNAKTCITSKASCFCMFIIITLNLFLTGVNFQDFSKYLLKYYSVKLCLLYLKLKKCGTLTCTDVLNIFCVTLFQ